MKCDIDRFAYISFIVISVFLSGFIFNHALAQTENNTTNVKTTFSNVTSNVYETNSNLINSINELDTKIQNLDDSNFVNPTLAKNILHNDLEKVKLAILDGEQYATYSILVNMTKEIQDPNLVTTTGKDKILPMSDVFIESVKIETTPINPAASAPLENYVYNDTHLESNQSQWRSYIWIITGLVVAAAGWTMFAINRNRVIPA